MSISQTPPAARGASPSGTRCIQPVKMLRVPFITAASPPAPAASPLLMLAGVDAALAVLPSALAATRTTAVTGLPSPKKVSLSAPLETDSQDSHACSSFGLSGDGRTTDPLHPNPNPTEDGTESDFDLDWPAGVPSFSTSGTDSFASRPASPSQATRTSAPSSADAPSANTQLTSLGMISVPDIQGRDVVVALPRALMRPHPDDVDVGSSIFGDQLSSPTDAGSSEMLDSTLHDTSFSALMSITALLFQSQKEAVSAEAAKSTTGDAALGAMVKHPLRRSSCVATNAVHDNVDATHNNNNDALLLSISQDEDQPPPPPEARPTVALSPSVAHGIHVFEMSAENEHANTQRCVGLPRRGIHRDDDVSELVELLALDEDGSLSALGDGGDGGSSGSHRPHCESSGAADATWATVPSAANVSGDTAPFRSPCTRSCEAPAAVSAGSADRLPTASGNARAPDLSTSYTVSTKHATSAHILCNDTACVSESTSASSCASPIMTASQSSAATLTVCDWATQNEAASPRGTVVHPQPLPRFLPMCAPATDGIGDVCTRSFASTLRDLVASAPADLHHLGVPSSLTPRAASAVMASALLAPREGWGAHGSAAPESPITPLGTNAMFDVKPLTGEAWDVICASTMTAQHCGVPAMRSSAGLFESILESATGAGQAAPWRSVLDTEEDGTLTVRELPSMPNTSRSHTLSRGSLSRGSLSRSPARLSQDSGVVAAHFDRENAQSCLPRHAASPPLPPRAFSRSGVAPLISPPRARPSTVASTSPQRRSSGQPPWHTARSGLHTSPSSSPPLSPDRGSSPFYSPDGAADTTATPGPCSCQSTTTGRTSPASPLPPMHPSAVVLASMEGRSDSPFTSTPLLLHTPSTQVGSDSCGGRGGDDAIDGFTPHRADDVETDDASSPFGWIRSPLLDMACTVGSEGTVAGRDDSKLSSIYSSPRQPFTHSRVSSAVLFGALPSFGAASMAPSTALITVPFQPTILGVGEASAVSGTADVDDLRAGAERSTHAIATSHSIAGCSGRSVSPRRPPGRSRASPLHARQNSMGVSAMSDDGGVVAVYSRSLITGVARPCVGEEEAVLSRWQHVGVSAKPHALSRRRSSRKPSALRDATSDFDTIASFPSPLAEGSAGSNAMASPTRSARPCESRPGSAPRRSSAWWRALDESTTESRAAAAATTLDASDAEGAMASTLSRAARTGDVTFIGEANEVRYHNLDGGSLGVSQRNGLGASFGGSYGALVSAASSLLLASACSDTVNIQDESVKPC